MGKGVRVAVVTANLGDRDKTVDYVEQSMEYDFYKFTDDNFRPRRRAMYPLLQSRIPKAFGWQMVPGYDTYIWMDASWSMQHPDSIRWFVGQCDGADIALFSHPKRKTIHEEAKYLVVKEKSANNYIRVRYRNELATEQLKVIDDDVGYVDDHLFAGGTFVYKDNERMRGMMKEWWYHISRYHTADQLSLPYVLWKFGCKVNVIPSEFYWGPYRTKNGS